jgi:hypothetical protein
MRHGHGHGHGIFICVLCVLCVGVIFRNRRPLQKVCLGADTVTDCLSGPHAAASLAEVATRQNARFRGRMAVEA